MIKSIVVPATGSDVDRMTFAAALTIARSCAAHIDALHVRYDPIDMVVATAAGDGIAAGGPIMQQLIDELEKDADKREADASRIFENFCAEERLRVATTTGGQREASAQWHVETGQEARWMAAYGLTADLIVAARGTSGDEANARSLLEALLLEAGRPLLIPSAEGAFSGPQRIVIGWKPTAQAARAVASAIPFIEQAARIVVVSVDEEGRSDTDRLVRYLAWHGIDARVERLAAGPYGPAQTMVDAAMAAKAELLVMGGYGHTRLREWVFGGFTQHLLAAAPLAVLIAH